MSYYFFLGDTMLPVPPAKMTLTIKGKNKTINLINEGEVNIIKTSGLSEISFDARFPNQKYPFANYDTSLVDSLASSLLGDSSFSFKGASYFLKSVETAKLSQEPLRFIVSRMTPDFLMLWDTNMLMTVEDYKVNEDAADGFDVIVPLRLKEWRDYGTKECEVTTDSNGVQHLSVKPIRPAVDMTTPRDYRIRNEQSIWEAVKGISGGKLNFRAIMKKSGITNPCPKGLAGTVLHLG